MPRLGFILTAPCSGGDQLGVWLASQRNVFVTENVLFGKFFEQWPTELGQMVPVMSVDRFVAEWSRNVRLGALKIDRAQFQQRFMAELIEFIVDFQLRQSQRQTLLDLVMSYPGTHGMIQQSIQAFMPEAPIVRLVRDARDTLVDQAFRWLLRDTHGTNRYAFFVERRPQLRLYRFFDDLFLGRWGTTWRHAAMMGEQLETQPATIRYEDWSSNRRAMLDPLTSSFGLAPLDTSAQAVDDGQGPSNEPEASSATTSFPVEGTVKRGAHDRILKRIRRLAQPFRRQIGIWQQFFTRTDGALLHKVAGDALLAHGYVTSSQWFKDLPDKLDPDALDRLAIASESE